MELAKRNPVVVDMQTLKNEVVGVLQQLSSGPSDDVKNLREAADRWFRRVTGQLQNTVAQERDHEFVKYLFDHYVELPITLVQMMRHSPASYRGKDYKQVAKESAWLSIANNFNERFALEHDTQFSVDQLKKIHCNILVKDAKKWLKFGQYSFIGIHAVVLLQTGQKGAYVPDSVIIPPFPDTFRPFIPALYPSPVLEDEIKEVTDKEETDRDESDKEEETEEDDDDDVIHSPSEVKVRRNRRRSRSDE